MTNSLFNIAEGPREVIEVFISLRDLKDLNIITKSDPRCCVFLKNDVRSDWKFLGKTEIVRDSLNPDFTTSFIFDYYFEKNQEIRFEVYDDDGERQEEQGKHVTKLEAYSVRRNKNILASLTIPKEAIEEVLL